MIVPMNFQLQIEPGIATYDKKNGYFRLYIDSTAWKNDSNVNISCRSILPGTVGLASKEICYNYVPSTYLLDFQTTMCSQRCYKVKTIFK